ncbi:MAG: HAD-IB family hydrolase [Bacteroidota bacterium]
MKTLALFDFDGTITSKDTLLEFGKFSVGNRSFYLKMVFFVPLFFLMKIGVISNQRGKELFLFWFIGRPEKKQFETLCKNFAEAEIPKMIREGALEKIEGYLTDGAKVIIVSASPENWIKPWAHKHNIEVLSTKLNFSENHFQGIEGTNCNGEEKVRRIEEAVDLSSFEKVIAYGDTTGDHPMLALAHEKHYKPFRE